MKHTHKIPCHTHTDPIESRCHTHPQQAPSCCHTRRVLPWHRPHRLVLPRHRPLCLASPAAPPLCAAPRGLILPFGAYLPLVGPPFGAHTRPRALPGRPLSYGSFRPNPCKWGPNPKRGFSRKSRIFVFLALFSRLFWPPKSRFSQNPYIPRVFGKTPQNGQKGSKIGKGGYFYSKWLKTV